MNTKDLLNEAENATSVEELFSLTGTDREAKAYAFLYASFKNTETSSTPVRDAVDCLIPFVIQYLQTINGQRVSSRSIQYYLESEFSFDIPLYAIDQIVSILQQQQHVYYNNSLRGFVADAKPTGFSIRKAEVETNFDEVVRELVFSRKLMDLSTHHLPATGARP